MNNWIRNFLKGMGSIFNIAPVSHVDLPDFVGSPAQRINRYWERVGFYISENIQKNSES